MTIGYTDLQHYGDIAAAIRTKGGAAGQLTPSQMAAAIAAIPSGGGGGDDENFNKLVARTLSGDITTNATAVGRQGLAYLTGLTSVNAPNATTIGNSAFSGDTSLTSVNAPNVTTVVNQAFDMCSGFLSANLPSCTSVGGAAFRIKETSVSMDNWLYADRGVLLGTGVTRISSASYSPTFHGLEYVILLATTPPTLSTAYTFINTRTGGYADYATEGTTRKQSARTGSTVDAYPGVFFVPDSAVSTYKSRTNWSSQNIVGISNCPTRIRNIYPYFN